MDSFLNKINNVFNDFKPGEISPEIIVSPPNTSYVCVKSQSYDIIQVTIKDLCQASQETLEIRFDEIYCLPLIIVK